MPDSSDLQALVLSSELNLSAIEWVGVEEISRRARSVYPQVTVSDFATPLRALIDRRLVEFRVTGDPPRNEYRLIA